MIDWELLKHNHHTWSGMGVIEMRMGWFHPCVKCGRGFRDPWGMWTLECWTVGSLPCFYEIDAGTDQHLWEMHFLNETDLITLQPIHPLTKLTTDRYDECVRVCQRHICSQPTANACKHVCSDGSACLGGAPTKIHKYKNSNTHVHVCWGGPACLGGTPTSPTLTRGEGKQLEGG